MQNEIWKDIPYYEGLYQVSNIGNVRSLNFHQTGKVRVLKPGKSRDYLFVVLCKDGKIKNHKVHRLVAQAFLENPDNLPQVNHINEIKTDNRVENLEFCTAKYNINYGSHNQRASEARRGVPRPEETKRKISEANSISVAQYSKDGKLIAIFYGTREAERQTGIDHSHIANCCNGRRKSAGNFIWKYA